MATLKDREEARIQEYEAKLKELQTEVGHLKSVPREPVVMNCDHEDEINQLQVSTIILVTSVSAFRNNTRFHTFMKPID